MLDLLDMLDTELLYSYPMLANIVSGGQNFSVRTSRGGHIFSASMSRGGQNLSAPESENSTPWMPKIMTASLQFVVFALL